MIRGTIVRDGEATRHLLVEGAERGVRARPGIAFDEGRGAVVWRLKGRTESNVTRCDDQAERRTLQGNAMTGLSVLYASEAAEKPEWAAIPERNRTGRLLKVYRARGL